jgi:hypothetical protein
VKSVAGVLVVRYGFFTAVKKAHDMKLHYGAIWYSLAYVRQSVTGGNGTSVLIMKAVL